MYFKADHLSLKYTSLLGSYNHRSNSWEVYPTSREGSLVGSCLSLLSHIVGLLAFSKVLFQFTLSSWWWLPFCRHYMSMNMADPCIEAGGGQTQELTYWVPCYIYSSSLLSLSIFTTLLILLIFTYRSYHSILLFLVLSNSTQSHPS